MNQKTQFIQYLYTSAGCIGLNISPTSKDMSYLSCLRHSPRHSCVCSAVIFRGLHAMNLDYDVVVYLDPWEPKWLELRSCLEKICNNIGSPRIILSSGGGSSKTLQKICLAKIGGGNGDSQFYALVAHFFMFGWQKTTFNILIDGWEGCLGDLRAFQHLVNVSSHGRYPIRRLHVKWMFHRHPLVYHVLLRCRCHMERFWKHEWTHVSRTLSIFICMGTVGWFEHVPDIAETTTSFATIGPYSNYWGEIIGVKLTHMFFAMQWLSSK